LTYPPSLDLITMLSMMKTPLTPMLNNPVLRVSMTTRLTNSIEEIDNSFGFPLKRIELLTVQFSNTISFNLNDAVPKFTIFIAVSKYSVLKKLISSKLLS